MGATRALAVIFCAINLAICSLLKHLADRRQTSRLIPRGPQGRALQRAGALAINLGEPYHNHGAWVLAIALKTPTKAGICCQPRRAVPLTRTDVVEPGTMKYRLTRPSRTMLRRLSIRSLPFQSGINRVSSSSITTTGP